MTAMRSTSLQLPGVAVSLLAALALTVAAESKPDAAKTYKLADGPCAVEVVKDIVLHDAKRNKDLPVHLTFPKTDGKFPIIVFSHGAGGSGDGVLTGLPKFWSSHGYVCLMPTHADSIKLRRQQGERDASMMDIVRRAVTRKEDWENRPRDITFLLDSLDELEKKLPAIKGKPDRSRIGIGGHSFGAFTAQVVGGATIDIAGDGKAKSFADKRVKAVLQLSGQGKGQMGLHEHSWDSMKLKQDQQARAWLQSDALTLLSHAAAKLERR
jgi:predicted dienelactone hydrolase